MSRSQTRFYAGAILATAVILSIQGFAVAEDLDAASIARALAPQPITRSLSTTPAPAAPERAADEAFVKGLNGHTRSLSVAEVSKIDAIVATRKDIDIEMHFGLNSASLRGKDRQVVDELGKALAGASFKNSTFLIMGHTDARGQPKANQKLSERRADAVKQVLVKQYGVPAEHLVTVGYGQTHLKNVENPQADENRRVQVVNIMAFKAAEK